VAVISRLTVVLYLLHASHGAAHSRLLEYVVLLVAPSGAVATASTVAGWVVVLGILLLFVPLIAAALLLPPSLLVLTSAFLLAPSLKLASAGVLIVGLLICIEVTIISDIVHNAARHDLMVPPEKVVMVPLDGGGCCCIVLDRVFVHRQGRFSIDRIFKG